MDPSGPHHFGAADTLSDTLRKMSASKKLWITGSSAKEGRSEEGLGAGLLGAVGHSRGKEENQSLPQVPLFPGSGGSVPSARRVVSLNICDNGHSFQGGLCREFHLWGLDFAIVNFHVMGRDLLITEM